MKIYTKTGDKGNTGLIGGVNVPKNHPAIEACGSIDELNCSIGIVGSSLDRSVALQQMPEQLRQIQNDLFDLGSRVAACLSDARSVVAFDASKYERLESWIDQYDATLPPLTAFILPSGTLAGSQLHLARSVCRRAERRLVELSKGDLEREYSTELIYLNRLSDLLFVLSRAVNQEAGVAETQWQANKA